MEVNSFDDLEAMKDAVNAQMVEGIVVYSIHHLPDQAKNAITDNLYFSIPHLRKIW